MSLARERFSRRATNNAYLRRIYNAIRKHDAPRLNIDDLLSLTIAKLPMALESGKDTKKTSKYCTPFPHDRIDAALATAFDALEDDDDDLKPTWPEFYDEYSDDPDSSQNPYSSAQLIANMLEQHIGVSKWEDNLLARTKWSRTCESTRELTFRDSHEMTYRVRDLGVGSVWEFEMHEIFYLERISQPHLACLLVNGGEPKEDLCRGELLCAMSLLWQGVARDKKYKYRVHPVIVYSVFGRKARILEVSLSDSTECLTVRVTPYVDFHEENEANLKLYLRWMMNEPVRVSDYHVQDPGDSDTSSSSGAGKKSASGFDAESRTSSESSNI